MDWRSSVILPKVSHLLSGETQIWISLPSRSFPVLTLCNQDGQFNFDSWPSILNLFPLSRRVLLIECSFVIGISHLSCSVELIFTGKLHWLEIFQEINWCCFRFILRYKYKQESTYIRGQPWNFCNCHSSQMPKQNLETSPTSRREIPYKHSFQQLESIILWAFQIFSESEWLLMDRCKQYG